MTDTTQQLIATFESLSANKQHEVVSQLLRRTSNLPESPLSDDDMPAFADDLFQLLDAEESSGDDAVTTRCSTRCDCPHEVRT